MFCVFGYMCNYMIKHTLFLLITGIVFFATCCQKTELNEDTPDCIRQKINEYKHSTTSCESGKSVYRYHFQGTVVYVFNPGDCGADMMSTVYDQECNVLCGLGGITGNIMCNGEDFGKNATHETLIWEN